MKNMYRLNVDIPISKKNTEIDEWIWTKVSEFIHIYSAIDIWIRYMNWDIDIWIYTNMN
jgi:hypothetical protein